MAVDYSHERNREVITFTLLITYVAFENSKYKIYCCLYYLDEIIIAFFIMPIWCNIESTTDYKLLDFFFTF